MPAGTAGGLFNSVTDLVDEPVSVPVNRFGDDGDERGT
jgi:hypothetical protein